MSTNLKSYWKAFQNKHGYKSQIFIEAQRHAFACGFRAGIKAQKELTDEWRQFKANSDPDPTNPAEAAK